MEIHRQRLTSHRFILFWRLLISVGLVFLAACSDDGEKGEDGTDYQSDLPGYKILSPDGEAYGAFGSSVSISGNHAIIGAKRCAVSGEVSGSAYIFQRSNSDWIEAAELTASDGKPYDEFGSSVSIAGDFAIVGADYTSDGGSA